jgi:RimJ/RimL family protein N-acetyltransferase
MFDIRLSTPDLELRHLTEADLGPLASLLPKDLEQDPSLISYDGLDLARGRGVAVHQEYWRARGRWRPESWELSFGVFRDGELIGQQGLEGDDFPTLRTVDSSSYLAVGARGLGLGKQMRAAVLALAFGALGARFAVTSAWSDNHASLGVSRALGYADNGVTVQRRGDAAGEMVHLRLTRERWVASPGGKPVSVSGIERCLPFFGIH